MYERRLRISSNDFIRSSLREVSFRMALKWDPYHFHPEVLADAKRCVSDALVGGSVNDNTERLPVFR